MAIIQTRSQTRFTINSPPELGTMKEYRSSLSQAHNFVFTARLLFKMLHCLLIGEGEFHKYLD